LALSAPVTQFAKPNVDFVRDVQSIFKARCYECHGAKQQMNGLRLDRREDALRGGYSGPAILPRKSVESRLIQMVTGSAKGRVMPPIGARLTATQIDVVRAWIDQGADWPEIIEKPLRASSTHWSFQPIRGPEPPSTRKRDWVRNPIDAFVLARLEAEGLEPSPEADKRTLARRVFLDLIGLPPSPTEVEAFLSNNRTDSYEDLVDRLLQSPHYGEKWARPWLDQAHYADSDGYDRDLPRPHAWRYRHWVIQALNGHLPFDRFTIEQIAGDLLPHSTVEQKVATGFLRNTLSNRESGSKLEQFRHEQIVDRTNTVGTLWLGLTVRCAQCHGRPAG